MHSRNTIEFVQNSQRKKKVNEGEQNDRPFTVLLNGQKDLEDQLTDFKKVCDAYDKKQRKRRKRRYYNLALMAEVINTTTSDEVKRLLKNHTRTFLVDVVKNKPREVEALIDLIRQSVGEQKLEDPNTLLVIGVALQITGDTCRLGRNRNNCSLFLAKGNTMTLTTDTGYRYSGFKEIAYVINFKYYLPFIKLNDEIFIGPEVQGIVIKKLKTCIAIRIVEAGIVNSYDYLEIPNQCNCLKLQTISDMYREDLDMASRVQADFIVAPRIRCLAFLKSLHAQLRDHHNCKLIANIDLEYVSRKMLDLMGLIRHLDYLWLTNLFNNNQSEYLLLIQDVIPLAKCLKKPIIGSVPLQHCSDFKLFENHEFLWKIDCMFIAKSQWCNKYRLIVKKLLPIKNYRLSVTENPNTLRDILSSFQSIVNFIIRTISSIECQAIFLYTKCETAAAALARSEIYCPVFVVIPLDDMTPDSSEKERKCVEICKNFNLRRNLRPILYTKEMNECDYQPIDYSIEYVRRSGCLETGGFIITLEVAKENGDDNVQLGVGEDVVIMRAFYLPPQKVGDKFICN